MRQLSSQSIILISIISIILPLCPLSPVNVIRDFVRPSLPLFGGVLHLASVPVLILRHGLSAHWHVY